MQLRARYPGRILLCDAVPSTLLLSERILTRAGHQVDGVRDAKTAMAALEQGLHQLILVEHQPPHLVAPQLLDALRPLGDDLPAMVMAHGVPPPGAELPRLVAWLQKPFSISHLLGHCDLAIATRRRSRSDAP